MRPDDVSTQPTGGSGVREGSKQEDEGAQEKARVLTSMVTLAQSFANDPGYPGRCCCTPQEIQARPCSLPGLSSTRWGDDSGGRFAATAKPETVTISIFEVLVCSWEQTIGFRV